MNKLKYYFDCQINQNWGKPTYQVIETCFGKIRFMDTGEKSKPCLVMVPDGPCVVEHFDSLVKELTSEFRVVVFDMPGFGFSFPKNGYNHSLQSGSDAIHEVFMRLNLPKATLAFSCANGFYATVFATQHPEAVKNLILIQTPSYTEMEHWVKRCIPYILRIPFLGQLFSFFAKKKMPGMWFPVALPKSNMIKEWISISVKNFKQGGCNCLASVVQGLGESDQNIPLKVTCPTVMVWGKQDKSHRSTDPNTFLKLVPNAKIEIWDHVGHFANLEDIPRFKNLILKEAKMK